MSLKHVVLVQVRGEVSDKNELQNGGGEETNLQAGNNEEFKVREQKGYEMQTRNEENEKKVSQVGVQEGGGRARGGMC